MRAPFSFFLVGRLARLALLAPSLALAQNPPPLKAFDFAGAADAAAPTAPLVYQGMAPPRPAPQLGAQDWRAANAAVGQFPRGHADIVGWEAAQAKGGSGAASAAAPATSATSATSAAPAAPMQHGGNPAMAPAAPPHGGAHPRSMHPKGQP